MTSSYLYYELTSVHEDTFSVLVAFASCKNTGRKEQDGMGGNMGIDRQIEAAPAWISEYISYLTAALPF